MPHHKRKELLLPLEGTHNFGAGCAFKNLVAQCLSLRTALAGCEQGRLVLWVSGRLPLSWQQGHWVGRGALLQLSACWFLGTVLLERRSINILLSSQERKLTQAGLPSAGRWAWTQCSMRAIIWEGGGGLFVLLPDGARARATSRGTPVAVQKSLLALSRLCRLCHMGQEANSPS